MIEALLGDLSAGEFLDRFYTRLPHSRPGGAIGFASFPGWPALEAILGREGVDAFLAGDGRIWEGGRRPSAAEAREEHRRGRTLVVRNAERHDPELARIAAGFEADFAAPANIHVYATPAGRTGFGWHYDPEDVFVVQTHGSKEYRLRKNTVNPWPLLEQMPRDLGIEREGTPTLSCLLRPGDWLYLPAGWWHVALGAGGDSVTLAIGLMTPAAIGLLDFARKELLSALPWRQRLPVMGAANPRSGPEIAALHRSILSELRKDLDRVLADPALIDRYVSARRRSNGQTGAGSG